MTTPIEQQPNQPPRKKPPSFLFRLIIPVTFVFAFSCFLILTHDLTGDQDTRFARLLRDHGTRILAYEAAAVLVLAFIAMAVDRIRIKRAEAESTSSQDEPGDSQ